jgi:hypothetical protein
MLFSSLLSVAVLFGTALSATNLTVLLQYPACAVSPCSMLHLEASILTSHCRPSALVRSWQSPNARCLIFHNVYVPTRLYNMPLQFASSAHAISRNKLVCSSVSHQNLCLRGKLILMRGNSIVDPYAKWNLQWRPEAIPSERDDPRFNNYSCFHVPDHCPTIDISAGDSQADLVGWLGCDCCSSKWSC